MTAAVTITGLGQILVAVEDVDRAAAFYGDVLGLPLLFRFPGMAFFDAGGVRLYLTRPETPDLNRTAILYYRVANVVAATAGLEAKGVTVVHPAHVIHRDDRHALWMSFLLDSEGNTFALMAEVPAAEA